jgi:hypothetical protein
VAIKMEEALDRLHELGWWKRGVCDVGVCRGEDGWEDSVYEAERCWAEAGFGEFGCGEQVGKISA